MNILSNLVISFILLTSLSLKSLPQTKSDSVLVNEITDLIVNRIDTIKTEYYKISSFKDYPFQTASLFILSDVMLNEWQLHSINTPIFTEEVPAQVEQLAEAIKIDSTNLFNHRIEKIGKYYFGLYGSETNNKNFLTINNEELQSIFGIEVKQNLLTTKESLLDKLLQYSKDDNYFLPGNLIDGFNELGLMQREIMSIPKITEADKHALYELSAIIESELIKLINERTESLEQLYNKSIFKNEFSFQQYYNAWYLNIVTAVTNNLIEMGYIKVPVARNFNFIILSD